MKSIGMQTDLPLDFALAKRLADAVAGAYLGECVCLSWADQAAGQESPSHAAECHGSCEVPGYVEYAINRGAELKVVFGPGEFVFCFRPLGEFAAASGGP